MKLRPAQAKAIREAAAQCNVPVSTFVREMVLRRIGRQDLCDYTDPWEDEA